MGAGPSSLAVDTRTSRVFVGGAIAGQDIVSVLDARSGATGAILRAGGGPPYTSGLGGGPMAADERLGRVFALGSFDDSYVSVLDARSGAVLRAIPVGPNARLITVDDRTGRVIVVGDAGMSMLDARSGRLLHVSRLSGAANSIQVDEATGRVFVADAVGTGVSAYNGRTGRLLWTGLAGLVVSGVAVDPRRGHVLVAAGTTVYELATRKGAILKSIPVNGTPAQLAIDERTGHTLVAIDTHIVPASAPWSWLPRPLRRLLPITRSRQSTGTMLSSVDVLDTTR
jgi:DNA-binding beta-propeller fold protein YncE